MHEGRGEQESFCQSSREPRRTLSYLNPIYILVLWQVRRLYHWQPRYTCSQACNCAYYSYVSNIAYCALVQFNVPEFCLLDYAEIMLHIMLDKFNISSLLSYT